MKNSFDEIVMAIDAKPGIMDYTFADGNSMWLAVRFDLRMMNFRNSSGQRETAENEIPLSKQSVWKYIWFCRKNSPWKNSSKTDILSVANYEDNDEIPNWWTAFLQEVPEFSRRELLYSHRGLKFGHIANTYALDDFYYRVLIKKKLLKLAGKTWPVNGIIDRFISMLKGELSDFITEKDFKIIKASLQHIDSVCVGYRQQIEKYLGKTAPKMIVCSEGNNGDWRYGILFSVARKAGIPTAEVQHGALGLGMVFEESLVKRKEFRQHKSDFLFTFGNDHNSKSNAAVKNVSLGHYRLEKTAKNLPETEHKPGEPLKLLFICEGIPATAIGNRLVTCVQNGLKKLNLNYELVVRLHPTEQPSDKYKKLFNNPADRYSTYKTDDIYALVSKSDLVIGHTSTVLFEALYFGKPVLIYKDRVSETYIPGTLGKWFENEDEFAGLVNNMQIGQTNEVQREEFWAGNTCAENFRRFWKSSIETEIKAPYK